MRVITSNPLLQDLYGGHVVPHVRATAPAPEPRVPGTDDVFRIAFVGTVREHKGITELRAAAAELARRRNVRLSVTASAPPDALPWEDWTGHTSLAGGLELLRDSDAVAIVSRPGVWGDHQLPVKLIDAMTAGVPAVVTARPPLLWATGGAALVARDGSVADLAEALALLADDTRLALGARDGRVATGLRRLHTGRGGTAAPRGRERRRYGPPTPALTGLTRVPARRLRPGAPSRRTDPAVDRS